MEENTNTENKEIKEQNPDFITVLNQLNDSIKTNTESIQHLEEYLVLKDQEKEEQQKKDKEAQDQEKEETAKAEEQSSAKADSQTETYTELLTEINEGVQLTNQLLTVQGIYFGIVIGLLFIKIFVDRLTKK